MKNLQRLFCRFSRDDSGAAVTEFGLILVPFSILLMGAFDLGYQNYPRLRVMHQRRIRSLLAREQQ